MKNNLFARVGPKLQENGTDKTRYPTLNVGPGFELIDEPHYPRYSLRISSSINVSADSLTDLRSYTPVANNTVVYLKGYDTPGDGGSGFFYWNSGSTSDEVGSIVVKVTGSSTGRWERIFEDNVVNVKWFGAKGDGVTDDRQAIQDAIDYSLYLAPYTANFARIPEVFIPKGKFIISGTVHVGYGVATVGGVQYHSINIRGSGNSSVSGFPGLTSTVIEAVFTGSQPAINVQSSRIVNLSDFCVVGQYDYLSNKYNTNAGDTEVSFWQDPTWPSSSWEAYAPYAGISLDGYAGASPADTGYTAYPDMNFPSYFTGSITQYNKGIGSVVRMSNITVEKFCVGVGRWSTVNDNGEYYSLKNSVINECIYGFSVNHNQARNVEVSNTSFTRCFICIDGVSLGLKAGKLQGNLSNISVGGCITFISGNAGYAGPVTVRDSYGELLARPGELYGNPGGSTLTFDGCQFFLRECDSTQTVISNPKHHIYTADAKVILRNTQILVKHALVVDGGGEQGPNIICDGAKILSYTTGSAFVRSAESICGIVNKGNVVSVAGGIWTLPTISEQARFTNNEYTRNTYMPCWGERTQFRKSNQSTQFGFNYSAPIPKLQYSEYIGLTETIVSRSGAECQIPRTISNWPVQLDTGDTLRIDTALFVVKGVTGSNALLEQVSHFEIRTGSFVNLSNSDTAGAKVNFINCGRMVKPNYTLFGTVTSGSNVITNVKGLADGNQFADSYIGSTIVTGSYLVYTDIEGLILGDSSNNRINKLTSWSTGSHTMTFQDNFEFDKQYFHIGFFILEDNP